LDLVVSGDADADGWYLFSPIVKVRFGNQIAFGMWTMNDNGMMNTARLRKKAAHCRQLARQARSDGIAIEFGKLADDYDEHAARLELFDPEHQHGRTR
jgi:hypothetical protein